MNDIDYKSMIKEISNANGTIFGSLSVLSLTLGALSVYLRVELDDQVESDAIDCIVEMSVYTKKLINSVSEDIEKLNIVIDNILKEVNDGKEV